MIGFDDSDIVRLNSEFEGQSAETILQRVLRDAPPEQVVATSSFQNQSIPFLHLLSQVAPQVPVLFLDTGFHFPETLVFRDQLASLLGLQVRTLRPASFPPAELFRESTDACCALNKVNPLDEALQGASVWITGVRRSQTEVRRAFSYVERHRTGVLKVNPILDWTDIKLLYYFREYPDLPRHPLGAQGYESIGCRPCTRRGQQREGRWQGQDKTECGLHG